MNIASKKYDPQIIEEKRTSTHGETVVYKYTKGKFLGKGGFAKCYEFTNQQTNQILAAKIVSKDSLTKHRAKQKLMSEIKIHRSLHHTGIVGFESFFEDSENVFILLELCQNQTLNELIRRRKRLTEIEAQCFMMQLIKGLKYLHDHKVIHRDLKPANILIHDGVFKIADFGFAKYVDYSSSQMLRSCVGSPLYMAP